MAGALVLLSDVIHSLQGHVAATSDARGEFTLRSIGGPRRISACSDRHAPSPRVAIEGSSGAQLDLRLVLADAAGIIDGVVLDPRGNPVRDASVRLGQDTLDALWRPRVLTDTEGRFRLSGIAVGKTRLEVRGYGLIPKACTVDVKAAQTTRIDIRLDSGASAQGAVRTTEGKPVPGAFVSATQDRSLGVQAWSAADGTYRLDGITPGKVRLNLGTDGFGSANASFSVAHGEVVRWDVLLEVGRSIAGRLLDEHGGPVPGWSVALSRQSSPEDTVTDVVEPAADGTFRFMNVAPEEHRLRATPSRGHGFFHPALVEHVQPGANAVELRVTGMPSVRIVGTLLDAQGRASRTAILLPSEPTCKSYRTHALRPDAQTGRFALGPYPPGTWSIRARESGSTSSVVPPASELVLGPRRLAAGEVWDLGIVLLPPKR